MVIQFTENFSPSAAGIYTFTSGIDEHIDGTVRVKGSQGLHIFSIKGICLLLKADTLILNEPWSIYALLISLIRRRRIVLYLHGMMEEWPMSTGKVTLKRILRSYWTICRKVNIVTTSDREMGELTLGLQKKVLMNRPLFKPAIDKRLESSKNREHIQVTYIGRISEKKNPIIIAKAANELLNMGYEATFDFYGPIDCSDNYISAFRTNLNEFIRYHGPIYGEAKFGVLAETDLFVLLSESENYGYVVPEALSQGCSVVVSRNMLWAKYKDLTCVNVCDCTVEAFKDLMMDMFISKKWRFRQNAISLYNSLPDSHNYCKNLFDVLNR